MLCQVLFFYLLSFELFFVPRDHAAACSVLDKILRLESETLTVVYTVLDHRENKGELSCMECTVQYTTVILWWILGGPRKTSDSYRQEDANRALQSGVRSRPEIFVNDKQTRRCKQGTPNKGGKQARDFYYRQTNKRCKQRWQAGQRFFLDSHHPPTISHILIKTGSFLTEPATIFKILNIWATFCLLFQQKKVSKTLYM